MSINPVMADVLVVSDLQSDTIEKGICNLIATNKTATNNQIT